MPDLRLCQTYSGIFSKALSELNALRIKCKSLNGLGVHPPLTICSRKVMDLASDTTNIVSPTHNEVTLTLEMDVHKYSGTYTNPATRADFAPLPLGTLPQLLATWPTFWTSHARAIFLDKNRIVMEFSTLFPNGYGADISPFNMVLEIGQSEFSFNAGEIIGFRLKVDTDVAEAWFQKVL
ncbi:hypothetical protein HWV62_20499 [Athelia sp. TMB]|nr:hypothetical protein HWV62_20499 [Athelia sp. TMB]